jgi:hypothetical protein
MWLNFLFSGFCAKISYKVETIVRRFTPLETNTPELSKNKEGKNKSEVFDKKVRKRFK